MSQPKQTCFVLMPFTVRESDLVRYRNSDHWTDVYEGLIVAAALSAGIDCRRDDSDRGARVITEHIFRKIEEADLILCDLSNHNPNVFLELGWALRADKTYVLIKDDLTDFTFDLSHEYTFTYSHSLLPRRLQQDIRGLGDVLKFTVGDSERRYSWIHKLSLRLASISAAREGDVHMKLLIDIQQTITAALRDTPMRSSAGERFPWPILLKKATVVLAAVKKELDRGEHFRSQDVLQQRLGELSDRLGATGKPDIQFSVLDEHGVLLYHHWPNLIGRTLADIFQHAAVFEDIQATHSGAVAWTDDSSHTGGYIQDRPVRRNIGLFAEAGPLRWKVFVETHVEF